MNSGKLLRRVAPVTVANLVLAAANVVATILLVRWFEAAAYATYTIVLAQLSLAAVVLEIVPSAYSVFRAQDNPDYADGLAAVSLSSGVAIALLVVALGMIGAFEGFSAWLVLYGFLLGPRRYLDVRLQASGRLRHYFAIEAFAALLRVPLMAAGIASGLDPFTTIWGALAVANFTAQLLYLLRSPQDLRPFGHALTRRPWAPILADRTHYPRYYAGTALKRLKDNLVPLLADLFFIDRQTAGTFFLAYRGLLFALGQIRVVEGVLNFRRNLEEALRMDVLHRAMVAIGAQVLSFAASVLLALASGVETVPWAASAVLSAAALFYVFAVVERADANARFRTASVNASLSTYIAAAAVSAGVAAWLGRSNPAAFAVSVPLAEALALLVLVRLRDGTGIARTGPHGATIHGE